MLRSIGLHPHVLPAEGEAPLIRRFGTLVHSIEHSEERDYDIPSMNVSRRYLYSHLRRLCFEYVMGPHYGFAKLKAEARFRRDIHVLGKHRWCAKTFPTLQEYQGLLQLFPGIKLVYIIRNGLDVVHSRTKFHGFRHLDFSSHCQTWAESIRAFRYLVDLEHAMQVRHEELVTDPASLFTKVFDFLGLPYHERPVSFVTSNQVIPLDQPTQAGVDVRAVFEARKPPYEAWTDEHRATFKAIAGEAMSESGYQIPF
jgi:hypothetical protein